jgi:hypothetical protein
MMTEGRGGGEARFNVKKYEDKPTKRKAIKINNH